jgi:WD40 repeat protein
LLVLITVFKQLPLTIWNSETKSSAATLQLNKANKAGIKRVAFSDDGKLFAAATDRGDVLLWNVGIWRTHKPFIDSLLQAGMNLGAN